MKIISRKKHLIKLLKKEKSLGFVPTMGGIHEGHLSLIKRSKQICGKTIVTIFINKPQFNKKDDFKNYPRMLKDDLVKLKKIKVDFLFCPKSNEIYKDGPNKNLIISNFSKKLCGKKRPGHFRAVVDIVDRFIKIIKPKKIFFGEKDMQQMQIINDFIKRNHKNVKLISCKTIREPGGLALSSRNFLLTFNHISIGNKVFKYFYKNKSKIINKNIKMLDVKKEMYRLGVHKIDYIEIVDINKIIKPFKKSNKSRVFFAYYLNSTRLIDNI